MLIDNETLLADSLAFGGTPEILDLGVTDGSRNPNPGPGKPLKMFFQTEATLTGATGIQVISDDDATPTDVLDTLAVPAAGERVEFYVPSTAGRYLTVALAGTASAGSYSCGVVMDVQTAA